MVYGMSEGPIMVGLGAGGGYLDCLVGPVFISITLFLLVRAVARENLTMANGTLLAVTTDNVKLSFDNAAVVTGVLVCAPITLLLTVPNALQLFAANGVGRLKLSRLNPLRPPSNHPSAVVDDEVLGHGK